MRIQELEQIVGTDRATIRFYEKEGLITPKRSDNGYREYSQADAEELKRICLLRQLGIGIVKIRSLQQGSEDFQAVLAEQVETLTEQIKSQKRARALCQTLQAQGVQYKGLDAGRYLKRLQEIQPDEPQQSSQIFSENVPDEIHPWRRFFARMTDYVLLDAIGIFIIVVLLRVRPLPGPVLNALLSVAFAAIFVPLETLMLAIWGTTPGKYIFGLQIQAIEGGNLTFGQAWHRAKRVYLEGMFLRLPLLACITMVRSYCTLTGRSFRRFARYNEIDSPWPMSWDSENEIIYHTWERKRGVVIGLLLACTLLLSAVTVHDAILPKHRGSQLSIAQFAENFNDYQDTLYEDVPICDKLQPDGTKYPMPAGEYVIDPFAGEYTPLEYVYTTENGYLKTITIHKCWEDSFFVSPINEITAVTMPVLLAQKGAGYRSYAEFAEKLDNTIGTARQENPTQHCAQGAYLFHDVVSIEWKLDVNQCYPTGSGYMHAPDAESPSLELLCTITINN